MIENTCYTYWTIGEALLTTPETTQYDATCPGEDFFLYWRTSVSLWRDKLTSLIRSNHVFIPVNWSEHTQNPDQYDFGSIKPENSLKELCQMITELGKEATILLPVGPVPFITNGGVPSFLSKVHSKNSDGLILSALDNSGKMNKLYSFYDPRNFQYYSKFLTALRHELPDQLNIKFCPLDCFYSQSGKNISTFEDHSDEFHKGLSKYISELKQPQTSDLKESYQKLIQSFYYAEIFKKFGESKELRMAMLGMGVDVSINRSFKITKPESSYFNSINQCEIDDIIPCRFLLPLENSGGSEVLQDYFETCVRFNLNSWKDSDDQLGSSFSKLSLLSIDQTYPSTDPIGLIKVAQKLIPSCFSKNLNTQKIHVINQCKSFQSVAKRLFAGQTTIANSNSFDREFELQLNTFVLENGLEVTKLDVEVKLSEYRMGDARLIVFDYDKLNLSKNKERFWEKLFSTIDFDFPQLSANDEIHKNWFYRYASPHELSYLEVRRCCLINPTDYKQEMELLIPKNYVFLKSVNKSNVELDHKERKLKLKFQRGGTVMIDLGMLE